VGALGDALNAAYGVRESRPWWRVRAAVIGLTIALAVFIISALMIVLYGIGRNTTQGKSSRRRTWISADVKTFRKKFSDPR